MNLFVAGRICRRCYGLVRPLRDCARGKTVPRDVVTSPLITFYRNSRLHANVLALFSDRGPCVLSIVQLLSPRWQRIAELTQRGTLGLRHLPLALRFGGGRHLPSWMLLCEYDRLCPCIASGGKHPMWQLTRQSRSGGGACLRRAPSQQDLMQPRKMYDGKP